jgi:hypothetical protein
MIPQVNIPHLTIGDGYSQNTGTLKILYKLPPGYVCVKHK